MNDFNSVGSWKLHQWHIEVEEGEVVVNTAQVVKWAPVTEREGWSSACG